LASAFFVLAKGNNIFSNVLPKSAKYVILIKLSTLEFAEWGAFMKEKINHALLPSSAALAYLGDAVHSIYVREAAVRSNLSKSKNLHNAANAVVNAERQARLFESIRHLLSEDELDVYRRAHNSRHLQRPKHASFSDYRIATGFEAVLGMLWWLGDKERIDELLSAAMASEQNDADSPEDDGKNNED
jgi:ribonuclease-3 family protein